MKMYQIAYKNLLRKKTRTILTILGISLSTWVLASLLGFNNGYEKALAKDIDQMGFQILVTAKGCPYEAATLMLKGGTGLKYMDEAILKKVEQYPEVKKLTPMIMHGVFDPNKGESGGVSAYLGIDPTTYPELKSYNKFLQGKWFTGATLNEAVMGFEAAELEQREVGDMILIPGTDIELKIVGVLKRTGSQDDGTIFVPMKLIQEKFNLKGKLTGIGIQVDPGQSMDKFEEKLYELPDVQVISMTQVKETILSLVATARVLVMSIAFIAILIAILGVVNTILMSVFERYQEIGILKSMGAMPFDIFKMIWIETILLCSVGGIIGNIMAIGLSVVTDVLIRQILPYAPSGQLVIVDGQLVLFTLLTIILIGILSGLYPAWKAASIRPLESIRSEGA
jgi:putative ABC transport system permease protein